MEKYETKRSAKRVRVEMPVYLAGGVGVTRDVSPSGVYFITDRTFLPGVPLSFVLELEYVFPGEPLLLHCRGKVVRVEEVGERSGVAASISEFWSAS